MMRVGGTIFGTVRRADEAQRRVVEGAKGAGEGGRFAEALRRAIEKVDALQKEADRQAEAVATGRTDDVHGALVAMQEAELALELTVQVVNRAIEAYREISRMQV